MVKQRTQVPAPVRRRVLMEAGFRCPIPRCGIEAPNLELHHIDEDPANHAESNLIPLCPSHHAMVTRGTIDRISIVTYKSLLAESFEYRDSETFDVVTRQEFQNESKSYLNQSVVPYRTTFVGPMFVHPDWLFDASKRNSGGAGYDRALYRFLKSVDEEKALQVRVICRNSNRYLEKLRKLVDVGRTQKFKDDVAQRIDEIWGNNRRVGPMLCCVDTGSLQIPTIHKDVTFLSWRSKENLPISESLRCKTPEFARAQIKIFDQIFDSNFRGMDIEVDTLRKFVAQI